MRDEARASETASLVPFFFNDTATTEIARLAEIAVFEEKRRADRFLASELRSHRELGPHDRRFVAESVYSLFRWWGWAQPIAPDSVAGRLLLASLLDDVAVQPAHRVMARIAGFEPAILTGLGDAPNWRARSEGFRRMTGHPTADTSPWRLVPPWLREALVVPEGDASEGRRLAALLEALQRRPSFWVRAQGDAPEQTWDSLRERDYRPWIHRRMTSAAKLERPMDVHSLDIFRRGRLEIQDLASQAVGLSSDPDPGERWWDVCAGSGGKALHLADLMKGRGTVVATDVHEPRRRESIKRARRSPLRNLRSVAWDGRTVPGKRGSYHGVLVDAPCSGIGTWRRNPDARWTVDREAIDRLAELQATLLRTASRGVKPGGTLVYSVCTLTTLETRGVMEGFLKEDRRFRLDPFPNPIDGSPTDGSMFLWPHAYDCDGMFIARLIRVE